MPGVRRSLPQGRVGPNEAQMIIEALTRVRPPANSTSALEKPVQFILFHSAQVLGQRTLDDRLESTWAAEVLRRMQRHSSARAADATRHAERNDWDKARARGEEKKSSVPRRTPRASMQRKSETVSG